MWRLVERVRFCRLKRRYDTSLAPMARRLVSTGSSTFHVMCAPVYRPAHTLVESRPPTPRYVLEGSILAPTIRPNDKRVAWKDSKSRSGTGLAERVRFCRLKQLLFPYASALRGAPALKLHFAWALSQVRGFPERCIHEHACAGAVCVEVL